MSDSLKRLEPASAASPDDLLTPRQVCAALNVSSATLSSWARNARVDFVTLPGGQRRYRRGDIDAIVRGEVSA